MTNNELRDLKRKLWEWGTALYTCKRKQEEIQRIWDLIQDARSLHSVELSGMPTGFEASDATQNAAIKIIDTYMQAIKQLTEDIENVMRKKLKMDIIIADLPHEQKKLLELRYMRGHDWEYIPLQMHYSKRQCFNIHDNILENIALNCTKLH